MSELRATQQQTTHSLFRAANKDRHTIFCNTPTVQLFFSGQKKKETATGKHKTHETKIKRDHGVGGALPHPAPPGGRGGHGAQRHRTTPGTAARRRAGGTQRARRGARVRPGRGRRVGPGRAARRVHGQGESESCVCGKGGEASGWGWGRRNGKWPYTSGTSHVVARPARALKHPVPALHQPLLSHAATWGAGAGVAKLGRPKARPVGAAERSQRRASEPGVDFSCLFPTQPPLLFIPASPLTTPPTPTPGPRAARTRPPRATAAGRALRAKAAASLKSICPAAG